MSHFINRQLIEIGRYLRRNHSLCHYNDFIRVFYAKFPNLRERISVETLTRALRKLRERGVFFTPPNMKGQFFLADRFMKRGGEG